MLILTHCNLKDKISVYPWTWIQLMSLYLVFLQSKKSYSKLIKIHFFMPYDALNGSFMEQCVFTLIGKHHLCKWERKDKDTSNIEKFKWFLHINRWAQIGKSISRLFLSSAFSYIILMTKLWFDRAPHYSLLNNHTYQKSFKAWHVSMGSQLHNLDSCN
jgi:hypothetical protein